MYRTILLTALLFGALNLFYFSAKSQYTLDEIGVNVGGGLAILSSTGGNQMGPGANINAFYGHYFCGKRYGIHTQGGFNFINTRTETERTRQLQFEGGFFFKVKRRDYHRPKEWAIIVGPKFQIPIATSTRYFFGSIQPVKDWTPVVPVAHVSLQFRRPAPEKKSWFIQPGFEYGLLPDYQLPDLQFPAGADVVSRTYFFLHFGYAFFDKRG